MNEYKKAIEVIDTLLHLMCGEEREDGYKPTMEEMSNSMDLLKELLIKQIRLSGFLFLKDFLNHQRKIKS